MDLSGAESGDVLVVGWGGTYGALRQAQQALAAQGKKVSHAHLRWLSPLEPGLTKIIKNFKHVIVAELNMGQLRSIIRDKFLVDAVGLNKIQGQPFKVSEVVSAIQKQLESGPLATASAAQPQVNA
jgi:2-oxoglutarate ferredoxin oxidoreductase subunit alpha